MYYGRKETIPLDIKKQVWERYQHPGDNRVAQCATCEKLTSKPKSISKDINPNKLPYLNIVGPGEFSHIISEKNGGPAILKNLTIQCKGCNLKLGSNNLKEEEMLQNSYNTVMLDAYLEDIDNMEFTKNICAYKKKNGIQCRNKPLENSMVCYVHWNKKDLF